VKCPCYRPEEALGGRSGCSGSGPSPTSSIIRSHAHSHSMASMVEFIAYGYTGALLVASASTGTRLRDESVRRWRSAEVVDKLATVLQHVVADLENKFDGVVRKKHKGRGRSRFILPLSLFGRAAAAKRVPHKQQGSLPLHSLSLSSCCVCAKFIRAAAYQLRKKPKLPREALSTYSYDSRRKRVQYR
jgi:hypothetical protein